MDGKYNFVNRMKELMGLLPMQGFTRGVSSDNISKYLRDLKMEYTKAVKDIKYAWKRMEGNRDGKKRGFNGKHVESIVRRNTGVYILFGRCTMNNASRPKMSRRLSGLRASEQLNIYARYAKGRSSANHAVSAIVVDGVRYLYDNAFTKIKKVFSIEALAYQMADISYCFTFDICEV